MLTDSQHDELQAEIASTRDLAREGALIFTLGAEVQKTAAVVSHGGEVAHRAPLPSDPSAAAAHVLAAVLDIDTDTDRLADASAFLAARNRAMLDPYTGTESVLSSLSDQLELLNALFMRYASAAQGANDANSAATLMRLALSAQSAFLKTSAALTAAYRARRKVNVVEYDDDTL